MLVVSRLSVRAALAIAGVPTRHAAGRRRLPRRRARRRGRSTRRARWLAEDISLALAVTRQLGIDDDVARARIRPRPARSRARCGRASRSLRRGEVRWLDATAANDPESLAILLEDFAPWHGPVERRRPRAPEDPDLPPPRGPRAETGWLRPAQRRRSGGRPARRHRRAAAALGLEKARRPAGGRHDGVRGGRPAGRVARGARGRRRRGRLRQHARPRRARA